MIRRTWILAEAKKRREESEKSNREQGDTLNPQKKGHLVSLLGILLESPRARTTSTKSSRLKVSTYSIAATISVM